MACSRDSLSTTQHVRPWMRHWLLAAGVYNLLWGAAVILFPDQPLKLFGVEPLVGTGRAIWQCLGMVIGVYGIGYIAASLDPIRHWPIVLVGFLGKILGPIGFVWCASRGEIDWRFGVTLPTNDLLWWVPFFLMLRASWLFAKNAGLEHAAQQPIGAAMNLARDQHGRTLASLTHQRPVLLVAVRHFGCTFCRESLAAVRAERLALETQGVQVAILHPADAQGAALPLAAAGLSDLPAFADPNRLLANALGIERGSFLKLLGPKNILRAIPALMAGHGVGYPVGDPLQMPATFLLKGGQVIAHHHHTYAGEPVDFRTFLGRAGLASEAIPAHT